MTAVEKLQSRPAGAWEISRKRPLTRRLTLRRADGRVYLDRWGIGHDRVGQVLVHRMEAPDPGIDLHDHPWPFVSIILWGGYTEVRAQIREAPLLASWAQLDNGARGTEIRRRWLSVKVLRLDECHAITTLHRRRSWSLVITGRVRRRWGFYMPYGYLDEREYDETVRADRRDLWADQAAEARPW